MPSSRHLHYTLLLPIYYLLGIWASSIFCYPYLFSLVLRILRFSISFPLFSPSTILILHSPFKFFIIFLMHFRGPVTNSQLTHTHTHTQRYTPTHPHVTTHMLSSTYTHAYVHSHPQHTHIHTHVCNRTRVHILARTLATDTYTGTRTHTLACMHSDSHNSSCTHRGATQFYSHIFTHARALHIGRVRSSHCHCLNLYNSTLNSSCIFLFISALKHIITYLPM